MLPETKPLLLAKPRKPYVPVLSAVERRAYYAAHAILKQGLHELRENRACPGGRRSAEVDHIARTIMEFFTGMEDEGAKTPR